MRHNLSIYDTGRIDMGSYPYHKHRNVPMITASTITGGILTLAGIIMVLVGLLDPMGGGMTTVFIGMSMVGIAIGNTAMFLTHRNFGLNKHGTMVMDAIYTLPKEIRNDHKINRDELKTMSKRDADRFVQAADEYRVLNTRNGGVGRLYSSLIDYNKMVREIEASDR